ncbi:MAG: hypothetical protein QG567_2154 [Campylobacterota bacterium]|nr:hypothetical protein [Campylobacterota bacterium]
MRIAKGFKGRYFSLRAMTVTSAQAKLKAQITAFSRFFVFKNNKEDEDSKEFDSPSPQELLLLIPAKKSKPYLRVIFRQKSSLFHPFSITLLTLFIFKNKTLPKESQ